ncbi:MAG: type II secretion system protein GspG [Candidatus Aminicenantes bacterium]|jgi:general secretion pathway protein G
MKKINILLMIGIIIGSVILIFNMNQCSSNSEAAGERIQSAKKTSFSEVTAKLNPGGSLYLYVSTEGIIKAVDEFAQNLRKLLETQLSKSPEESKEALTIFDFVFGLIKKSGLMEISGIGASSVAVAEHLNHSKVVVHHYKDKGKGLIWELIQERPHELTALKMLPADTVMAGFADCKLNVLWQWIKKQAEASALPGVKKAILSVEPMLQQQGIQLNQLLDSLTGMGYLISLDSSTMCPIPMGKMAMEIPEPAIAIMCFVKNESFFNLLQAKLPMVKPLEEKGMKKLQIPVPKMPFTLEPVIVQKGNMMIIASNNKILDAMFTAKEKGNGLITTEEFQKLSARVPGKGNSFRFMSQRFLQTFLDIQKKIVQMTKGATGKDAPAREMFDLFAPKMALFGVLQNTEEGTIFTLNHTMGFESLVLLPATAAAGIVAAIAIPNLLTALQKGKQKATMGDMKSISLAIEAYIIDHQKAPEAKTIAELNPILSPFYIKVLPLKDGWGNDYHYYHGTGDQKEEYAIGSGGKDGVFNGWDQSGFYGVTTVKGFDNDIIFANGRFVYSPKVK